MTDRVFQAKRYILLALVAGLLLLPRQLPAEPKLGKDDPTVARLVCAFLKQGHLSKPEIGDELSKRLFKRFLKDLDPNKLFFLKSDIEEFRKYETELDDHLLAGDLSFPYKVYDRLMKRLAQRQKQVEEFVAAKHDFTVKEYLETDPDTIDHAASEDEVKDRLRKRIKFDLLVQRIADKPVPEAEAKEKVLGRYRSLFRRWKQADNAELLELFLTALTTCVDPHSTYMSPTTLTDFEIAMRLNLDGIGAVLRSENGQTIVVEVVAGGAAGKDGRLKPKDKIVAVAQGDEKFVDVVEMKLQEVVKMIRGARGTKVQLKVVPVGKLEPIIYELTRQKIELKTQEARGEVVEQGKKADGKPYLIGVIDLPSFYADRAPTGRATSRAPPRTSASC